MPEYRFVCVDASGAWRDVRYATRSSDRDAKKVAGELLQESAAVIVYSGVRKLAVFAEIAGVKATA